MTTINSVYCVPRTVEEWRELGVNKHSLDGNHECVVHGNGKPIGCLIEWATLNGYNEIPVPRFLDLLHDRICAWRLEEVGFKPWPNSNTPASMLWENEAQYTIEVIVESVYVNSASFNITTFTDLLTQIKFITPQQ